MGSGGELEAPGARPVVFADTKFLAARPLSTLVPRPALLERMQAGPAPVTIVVGPPGAGKSWLLGHWFEHGGDGAAWLTADGADAEPVRFWRGFVAAVSRVAPGFGAAAGELISADDAVGPDALESLLVDDAALDRRVAVVIDDFHVVGPTVTAQVRHLAERGLQHLRLLIGSRSDPDIGLHRLRLRGDLCEIREADLRLSEGETRDLLAKLGLDPAAVDVAALHRRTEGWVAGVQLAALSVVGTADAAERIDKFVGSNQMIAGYLAAEVVANQTDRIRRFLEDTCVAEVLDADLARALCAAGGDEPVVTLEEVEAANLMFSRVDAAGTVFRYHQLFGEMLRAMLRSRDPDRYRAQHARAAEALAARGEFEPAIRHYWYAGRRDVATRLSRDHMMAVYFAVGAPPPIDLDVEDVVHDLAQAPGEVLGYGLALAMHGRGRDLSSLIARIDASPDTETLAAVDRLHLNCLRTAAALLVGDAGSSRDLALEVERDRVADGLAEDEWSMTICAIGVRAAAWEGDLATAEALAAQSTGRGGPAFRDVELPVSVALLRYEQGRLDDAVELATAGRRAAMALGLGGGGADVASRTVLASALVDRGELAAAAEHLDVVLGTQPGERVPMYVTASIARARLHRAEGHFGAAALTLRHARARLRSAAGTTLGERIDMVEIALHLAVGDVTAARELAASLRSRFSTDLVRAAVELADGRPSHAARLVTQREGEAVSERQRLELAAVRARIAVAGGDPAALVAAAETLFDAAETCGAVLPVAEAGSAVLAATMAAARRRPRSPFVERLLVTQPLPLPAGQARPTFKADELSTRELEVLRYMATSMSNQEIAAELFLSVNTVKTHVKHVLRKLSATSRAEAVQRAQALRYL